jgi:Tfp pilus assembly protein PilX
MTQLKRRRGGALVIALLTLMVVMLLSTAVLRSLLAARRQTMKTATALQVSWLAESALDRALVQIASDDSYKGETWQVEVLGDGDQPLVAVVRIVVKDEVNDKKQIGVSAELGGLLANRSLSTEY